MVTTATALLLTQTTDGPGPTLPGYIDGIEPEARGFPGPYRDGNGNLYRVTEENLAGGNNPRMQKSTNGGITWDDIDSANAPTGGSFNDLESGWLIQAGTVLIFVWTDDTSIFYCTFNTSDAPINPDKWQIKEIAFALSATSGSRAQASIARLSDGRVRTVFQSALSGTNNQVSYNTKADALAAGGWGTATLISATTANQAGSVCVVGAADKLHIFIHDIGSRQVHWRTLTSANALSAATRVDTAGTNTASANWHAVSNAVYFDNAGDEVVSTLYAAAAGLRCIQIVNGVATDTLVTSSNPLIESGPGADAAYMHLCSNGTTLLATWSDAATGDLLYASKPYGAAWSTPTLLWDAGTGKALWNYCNVYARRDGTVVMGYTYDRGPHLDDTSNTTYDELVLTVPAPEFTVSAGFGGSGTLSTTQSVAVDRGVSFSGSGALSTTQTPAVTQAAAFSGSGTLASTQSLSVIRAATFSGVGALSATQIATVTQSANLSGSGTLLAAPEEIWRSDNFNRADSPLAGSGAGWVTLSPGQLMNVVSQKVQPATTGGGVHVAGVPTPADMYVEADLVRNGSASTGLVVRAQDSANFYVARVNGSGSLGLIRVVASNAAGMAENLVTGIGVADVSRVGVQVVGNQFTVFYNGNVVGTASDATFSTGYSGIRLQSAVSQPTADNFIAREPSRVVSTAFGGSGTLSTTQAATVTHTAAFGGSGTLSTTQVAAVTRAAAFSGSGSLSTTQVAAVTRAAAFSGAGTLASVSSGAGQVSGPFSGSGTLSTTQVAAVTRAAAFSGSGSLSTTQVAAVTRAAAFSGSGTLTTGSVPGFSVTASLSGMGTLATTSAAQLAAEASFSGIGMLTGLGFRPSDYMPTQPGFADVAAVIGTAELTGLQIATADLVGPTGTATLVGNGVSDAVLVTS